jgi:hypothetical protein
MSSLQDFENATICLPTIMSSDSGFIKVIFYVILKSLYSGTDNCKDFSPYEAIGLEMTAQ